MAIAIPFITYSCDRYIKCHSIMGSYELVEGNDLKDLNIDLFNWSKGKEEDLKCNLMNCSGYEHGKYSINDNKIEFRLSAGHIDCYYEILQENNDTFLILKYSETDIQKYKKIN